MDKIGTGFLVNQIEFDTISTNSTVQLKRGLFPTTKVGDKVDLELRENGKFKDGIIAVITAMDGPPNAGKNTKITVEHVTEE